MSKLSELLSSIRGADLDALSLLDAAHCFGVVSSLRHELAQRIFRAAGEAPAAPDAPRHTRARHPGLPRTNVVLDVREVQPSATGRLTGCLGSLIVSVRGHRGLLRYSIPPRMSLLLACKPGDKIHASSLEIVAPSGVGKRGSIRKLVLAPEVP